MDRSHDRRDKRRPHRVLRRPRAHWWPPRPGSTRRSVESKLRVGWRANTLSASRLALADPSAKRVWVVAGSESIARAVTRGFLRGLLSLGLFSPASSQFPTGVDRVMTRGSITLAYGSTTRTRYRVRGSKGTAIAHDVAPAGFAIAPNSIIVWQNGALRLIR